MKRKIIEIPEGYEDGWLPLVRSSIDVPKGRTADKIAALEDAPGWVGFNDRESDGRYYCGEEHMAFGPIPDPPPPRTRAAVLEDIARSLRLSACA